MRVQTDQLRPAPAPAPGSAASSAAWPAGRGEACVEVVDGRSRLTRSRAAAPLKLLSPEQPGGAVWLYATTFGGGLVAGDAIDLHLNVGSGASAVLTTQASTKVYHHQNGLGTSQRLIAHVAPQATLVIVPDPLVCFANAMYQQHQRVQLQRGGSVVLLDWFTAGRVAYGERWVFDRYASRNELTIAGRLVANDALLLDPEDGPLTDIARMGWCDCMATLLIAGERFEGLCDALVAQVHELPLTPDAQLVVAASRTPWGALLRTAGRTTAMVADDMRLRLEFLRDILGTSPWDRKW
jgi:urease accessory protein